jgi:clan AA aspartic protease (TIGR02281 family)
MSRDDRDVPGCEKPFVKAFGNLEMRAANAVTFPLLLAAIMASTLSMQAWAQSRGWGSPPIDLTAALVPSEADRRPIAGLAPELVQRPAIRYVALSHTEARASDVRSDNRQSLSATFELGRAIASAANQPAARLSHEIPLARDRGTFMVAAAVNDSFALDFYLDSGAADVNLPLQVFDALRKSGSIQPEDIVGSEKYLMANGGQNSATIFVIKKLTVGSVALHNVRASVSTSTGLPLLGMSFLRRFASWSVDNERNVLILR